MSETAKKARADRKEKAVRMTTADPHQKVDASSWTPADALNTEGQIGLKPISRQSRKRGGMVEGHEANHHAGRKPRKSGGRLVDEFQNRDIKAANEERPGIKHPDGYKTGGRTERADGGPLAGAISQGLGGQGLLGFNYPAASKGGLGALLKRGGKAEHSDAPEDRKLVRSMVKKDAMKGSHDELHIASCRCHKCMGGEAKSHGGAVEVHHETCKCPKCHGGSVSDGTLEGTRPTGGYMARKDGGRAGKGKTNINIVIAAPERSQGPSAMPMPQPKPIAPPMPPPGMPPGLPPGMPPGAPPIGAGPPQGPPPGMMPRRSGGRTTLAGAGSGLGRLEKIRDYGDRA